MKSRMLFQLLIAGGIAMASSGTTAATTNAFNVTEALSKSTVRICCGVRGTNNVNIGTAFMVLFKQDQEHHTSIPVFITNKHVDRKSVV